jgi:hypothetical protein
VLIQDGGQSKQEYKKRPHFITKPVSYTIECCEEKSVAAILEFFSRHWGLFEVIWFDHSTLTFHINQNEERESEFYENELSRPIMYVKYPFPSSEAEFGFEVNEKVYYCLKKFREDFANSFERFVSKCKYIISSHLFFAFPFLFSLFLLNCKKLKKVV